MKHLYYSLQCHSYFDKNCLLNILFLMNSLDSSEQMLLWFERHRYKPRNSQGELFFVQ